MPLLILISLTFTAPVPITIEIEAGAHARSLGVVRYTLPDAFKDVQYFKLESLDSSNIIPGQIETTPKRELVFMLDRSLAAGAKRRFRLSSVDAPKSDEPALIQGTIITNLPKTSIPGRALTFTGPRLRLEGKPVLDYQEKVVAPPTDIDPLYSRSGFLHPIRTRSGTIVTDDFPPDHAHQHALFFAWPNVTHEGQIHDFWNQHAKSGRISHDTNSPSPSFRAGPISSKLSTRLRHEALKAKSSELVFEEKWTITAYDIPGLVVFDFQSDINNITSTPVTINKYIYGGLGFRGNRQWFDPAASDKEIPNPIKTGEFEFSTSDGKHRADGNHTRPQWVDLSGKVDGKIAGITILGHPSNFRHPQPVRLHPSKPYLSFAPEVLGPFEIKPEVPYVSQYRFVVHDGPADLAKIEALWNDYAHPIVVKIVP
jgi:hypothetical protein